MRKMMVIAMREFQAAVKTKAFIISLVAMPIFMGGSIVVQMLMRNKVDRTDKPVAIVDYSGVLFDSIAAASAKRDKSEVSTGEFRDRDDGIWKVDESGERVQVRPKYVFERVEPGSQSQDELTYELSERVRKKELFAFALIGPDVVKPGADVERAAVAYHSNSPTFDDIQDWLAGPINQRILEMRFAHHKLDPVVVREATMPTAVVNLGLVQKDAAGNIGKAETTNQMLNVFLPLGLMLLMFMLIMVGAQPLLHTVLEEKMQRIAEVLLGSVTPFQLMMGKVVGMVGVSLVIATIYLVGGYFALERAGYAGLFPTHLMWWFVIYVALAVLMFGALFSAVGAAVTDLREAQSMVTPLMLFVVAPLFVWVNVVREPNSTFATVFSLFPPATPMLMTIRQAVPPGIPMWQPVLGVVLVLITTVGCVWVAGRIFRVGILMHGKSANLGEMMRWIVRG